MFPYQPLGFFVLACVCVCFAQEMADISAPGSVMVASAVSRTVTDRMRRGGGDITSKWQWGAPGTVDEVCVCVCVCVCWHILACIFHACMHPLAEAHMLFRKHACIWHPN